MEAGDAHHLAHVARVAFEEHLGATEVTLLGGRTGGAQVRGQGMAALELACSGDPEPLGDALVRLEFVAHLKSSENPQLRGKDGNRLEHTRPYRVDRQNQAANSG